MSTPEKDAEALRNAMKGIGIDKQAIIKIIANRTNEHRQKIKLAYKAAYKRDLIDDLNDELGGVLDKIFFSDFRNAVLALFETPVDYDVQQLHKAMKGLGTDEDTLIEILATRPSKMLDQVKERYAELHKKDLEKAIESETSGYLKRLMMLLLQCKRSKNTTSNNEEECLLKAKELQEESKDETKEIVFSSVLAKSSLMELELITSYFHKLPDKTILQDIEKEPSFSKDMKKLLITIAIANINPSVYFATRVNKAVKGWGTNDNLLIRVLVTRDEIDMPKIKEYYKKLYGRDMLEDIKSDCSGYYRELLLELAGH